MTIAWLIANLLSMLLVSGYGSRRANNLWDKHNLAKCSPNVDYCSKTGAVSLHHPPHVLVGCTDQRRGLCRYRCPLGQPLIRYKPEGGRRCAAVCPSGYFVGMFHTDEVCRLHSHTCPEGHGVILPGTSWHDTICGKPEDYMLPHGLLSNITSDVFLVTLNKLAMTWVRDISEEDITKLCDFYFRLNQSTCKYNFEYLLVGTDMPLENIYYMLNTISSFETAKLVYSTIVKPFVQKQDLEPRLSIQFIQPDPWWVGEQDILVVQTRVTIPIGMSHRYIPNALKWYTGKLRDRLVVGVNKTSIVSSGWRYNITRGLDWTKRMKSFGFFVYMLDISLTVKNFHCGLFDSLYVDVAIYDTHENVKVGLHNTLDINCLWKPKLHPLCNCTHALLHYINPNGLCSPSCISTPFAHLSKGVEGSNNDWTLEITDTDPDTSTKGHGRVLYGTVPPKTERFCLVTMGVFNLSPGPRQDAPSAPLDVRRCDVVLVEFDIWIEEPPEGSVDNYLPIAVRALSNDNSVKKPELYIPIAAEDTLKTIIRQSWGDRIGVKFGIVHSNRVAPYQEELAAVFDWILTLLSQQNLAPPVVVIDVNVETVKPDDFTMITNLYGSKVELIPGLSASTLGKVIRARGYYTVYNYYKCIDKYRCSKLITIRDRDGNLLYQKAVDTSFPDCHEAPLSTQSCIVCQNGDILIICPNSIHPADIKNSIGEALTFQLYTPPQLHSHTRGDPLAPEQEQAETVLRNVGLLVSSHGAFLNLDTVSVFHQSDIGCENVKPGRWIVGEYTIEDPYVIKLPRDEQYPERTGLLAFEELCKRSNNRAGIVVSVPSSDYTPGDGCKLVSLLNRHVTPDPGNLDGGRVRVHYSMLELTGIIADMAKWGVCRYSMGYLDYTFGKSDGIPTFTELSRIISSAATKIRTVHYRYTRNSTFGDGGYSYAHVDGVYKLEGGMFFQRMTEGISLTKSFVLVPDVPNLRLGLSSDMNVGAPLPISEFVIRDHIEHVKFIPYGAQVVNLNYKNMVAFVDEDMDRICIHSPSAVVRSAGLRLPSFGIQSEEAEDGTEGCMSYISGAVHRARVLVQLPITRESKESVLQSISNSSHWIGPPVLTMEEEDWLSSKVMKNNRRTLPSPQSSQGFVSSRDSVHLISKTLECIRGSGSCMELGDYAENNWPQGGTGYPIAISSIVESDQEISIKIIIHVNHGVMQVKIPCNTKPFFFGSEQPSFPQLMQGYYMHTEEPTISKAKRYLTNVGPLTARIVQPLALLYCPRMNQSLADHLPSSEIYFQRTYDCVNMMNASLWDLRDVFSQLRSLIEDNEKTTELAIKRVLHMSTRTSALCLSAMLLVVLINITLIAMICSNRSRCSEQRYRKLQ